MTVDALTSYVPNTAGSDRLYKCAIGAAMQITVANIAYNANMTVDFINAEVILLDKSFIFQTLANVRNLN